MATHVAPPMLAAITLTTQWAGDSAMIVSPTKASVRNTKDKKRNARYSTATTPLIALLYPEQITSGAFCLEVAIFRLESDSSTHSRRKMGYS